MRIHQITEAPRRTATIAFGRMNPPTIGHAKVVAVVKSQGGDPYIFLSQSQKPKTDPLSFEQKLGFAKAFFPGVNVGDPEVRTIFEALIKVYKMGYTDLVYVAGSDRVTQFTDLINKYNGQEDQYTFDSIQVVSAGERDPDAEGAEGMSASKMRAAAAAGDFEAFKSGTPNPDMAQSMYDAVRNGMGVTDQEPVPEADAVNKRSMSGDTQSFRYTTTGGRLPTSNTSKPNDITKRFKQVDMPDEPYEFDFDSLDKAKLKKTVARLIDGLGNDKNKQVVQAYFGLGKFEKSYTLDQIAKAMGVTGEAIRQRLAKVLRQLRHSDLRAFMDDAPPGREKQVKALKPFVKFCIKKLELKSIPKIVITKKKLDDTFGYYDTGAKTLTVSSSDRHIADIMRTLAHELVHLAQDEQRQDIDGSDGSKHENQANAVAGVLMRKWANEDPSLFESEVQELKIEFPDAAGADGMMESLERIIQVTGTLRRLDEVKPLNENVKNKLKSVLEAWSATYEAKLSLPDLETGDELMVGKFKNRKATIKDFTKDKHNQPVAVTDKGEQQIFKGRVKKLMPTEGKSPHKKGTKKYKAHMAAMHAGMNESYKLQLERDDDLLVLHIKDTKTGKRTEVRGKPNYEGDGYDSVDKLHQLLDKIGKAANISELMNGEVVSINPSHPQGPQARATVKDIAGESIVEMAKKVPGEPGSYTMKQGKTEYKISPQLNSNDRPSGEWQIYVKDRGDWEWDRTVGSKRDAINWIKTQKDESINEAGVGRITKQNATKDAPIGSEFANVKKLGLGSGKPKELHAKARKNSDPNTLFNLGLTESVDYVKPQFDVEWEEANRYPYLEKLGQAGWEELAGAGKVITVNTNSVKNIENTGADGSEALDDLEPEKVARLKQAMDAGTIEMPIVVKQSDGSYSLVAGNTRLIGLITTYGKAKVWLVDASNLAEGQLTERGSIGVPLSNGIIVGIAPHRELNIKKSTPGKLSYNENVEVDISGNAEKGYVLSKIVVPKELRGTGVGSKIMQDLINKADMEGAIIALTPDTAFGGSKGRLIQFYKSFGFVPNKGRNKDFRYRETMIRYPKT